MELFLSGKELWSTLMQLSKNCRSRQMIAVPYIGKDSSSLLKLGKNDVLLCALTEQNSKAGNIYPAEIRLLQKQGVKVYQRDNLHAKIYVFGNKAVICSANLSSSSKNRLDEVGLLTNNPDTLRSIREWFAARLAEPVTPKWLEHCEQIYQPPKGGSGIHTKNKEARQNQQRTWILFGHLTDFPEFEESDKQKGLQAAKGYLEKPRSYNIEEFRVTGKYKFVEEIRRGDLIIQVIKDSAKTDHKVYPSGRVLGKKQFQNKNGTFVTYLFIEMPKNYRKIAIEKFRSVCKETGLILGNSHKTKEVSDRVVQDQILAVVSPEKLRKK